MSATIHNPDFLNSLREQPGSVFTQTRSGFDTGRRVFKCWQTFIEDLAPIRGDSDDTYPDMKVDTVVRTFDRAGVAMLDVSYIGLISNDANAKAEEYTYSVNYEPNGLRFTTTIDGNSVTVDTSVFHPQVTHVYVSDSLPDSQVGNYIEPGKFADLVPSEVIDVPGISQTWTYNVIYKGWKLSNRTIRESVNNYEISDTYTYDFVHNGVTVT